MYAIGIVLFVIIAIGVLSIATFSHIENHTAPGSSPSGPPQSHLTTNLSEGRSMPAAKEIIQEQDASAALRRLRCIALGDERKVEGMIAAEARRRPGCTRAEYQWLAVAQWENDNR